MKTALVKNFTAWVSYVRTQCQKVRKGTIFIHQLRPIRFRRCVGSDGPHRYCVFPASSQHAGMSRSACVNWWKTRCCWSHFLQIYSLLWPKRQPILKKKLLHDSNKKICIWSLDWKSSLFKKKTKNKKNKTKQILYNLIKNNTGRHLFLFFFYRVNTNNLLALKCAFFITAWLLRAGLRWDGPGQYQRAWLVKPLCSDSWYHCWDVLVLRWRTTKAVLFSANLRFRPSEQLGAWGLRLGLVRRALKWDSKLLSAPLQPARLDQVYKKHMWALKAPPPKPPAWAESSLGLATAIGFSHRL